jgi:hypothetical protein
MLSGAPPKPEIAQSVADLSARLTNARNDMAQHPSMRRLWVLLAHSMEMGITNCQGPPA